MSSDTAFVLAVLVGCAFALCAAVALITGEVAAVTDWIPHAGAHGHPPTLLGYIGLYCLFVFASVVAWAALAFVVAVWLLGD